MKNKEYVNNQIKKCLKEGKENEIKVGELLIHHCGGTYNLSSFIDDIKKHIDIWWNSPKRGLIGIDVKGLRKNNRQDTYVDDSIQWIEIKNTQGRDGWIFGKMDYVAFMTNTEVLFIKPLNIQTLILKNIVGKELVYVNKDLPFYQPYQRKDRKDIIVKIPTEDLRKITHFKISNNE